MTEYFHGCYKMDGTEWEKPLNRKPDDPVYMSYYKTFGGGVTVSWYRPHGFNNGWWFDPKTSRVRPRLGYHGKRK